MASYVKEYLAAVHINLAAFAVGSLLGGFGYLIQTFRMPHNDTFSVDEVSDLMTPSNLYGIGTGALIPLLFLNLIGRKKTLMLQAISCILGWIVIMGTKSYSYYLYIEFINGVTLGLLYTVVPIYIGEIASDEIRGSLGCLLQLMFVVGHYSATLIENFISFQVLTYIFSIVPIFMILTYKWLPETPRDCLLQYNNEDARKSLKYFRNNLKDEEFNKKLENLSASAANDEDTSGLLTELWRNRKSLLVVGVCTVAMRFSSMEVLYYIVNLPFFSFDNEQFHEVILPTSIIITKILGLVTVDWIGRRRLLLFCSVCSIFSNLVSGLSLFMQWNETNHLIWIPSLAMVISILCFSLGFNTITFVLLGELFTAKIKHVAAFLFVLVFAGIKKFDGIFLIYKLDIKYMCMLNIFPMIVTIVVIFAFLPETTGKSLTEIQLILHNKRQRNVTNYTSDSIAVQTTSRIYKV